MRGKLQRIFGRPMMLLAFCLCATATVFGQGGFGVITGKISDPNGAAVSGARVTAVNVEKNLKTEVVANDNGDYQVRLDHQFSEAHKTYSRFTRRNSDSGATRWAGSLSTANQNNVREAWGLTLNHDWTLSPSLLVNLRAGGNFNPFQLCFQQPRNWLVANCKAPESYVKAVALHRLRRPKVYDDS